MRCVTRCRRLGRRLSIGRRAPHAEIATTQRRPVLDDFRPTRSRPRQDPGEKLAIVMEQECHAPPDGVVIAPAISSCHEPGSALRGGDVVEGGPTHGPMPISMDLRDPDDPA